MSKSDVGFWLGVCCAARSKNSSNGLITKSIKSAELLIPLISRFSYFLETLKALCTEAAWAQISMLTIGVTSKLAIWVVPWLTTA